MQLKFSQRIFRKNSQISNLIKSFLWERSCSMPTDDRTWRTNTRFSQFCERAKQTVTVKTVPVTISSLSCNQRFFFNSYVTRVLVNCREAGKLTDEVFQQGTIIINHSPRCIYHWTSERRISRQPSPVQYMTDQKQRENVEYFKYWVTSYKLMYVFFVCVALRPNASHDLIILEVSRSQTATQHIR